MRFVPIFCAREGMVLAKTVYGKNGEMLLVQGTILKDTYIEKFKQLGFSGLYINDDISKDIVIVSTISEDLRMKTIKGIKDIFIYSTNEKVVSQKIKESKVLVENIVDEILQNQGLIVNMIDLKVFDEYTFYHCVNVAVLSIVLGVALRLSKNKLYKLGLSALLHDIGKVFVSKNILDKNGKLTDEEYEEVKKHPQFGYEYLKGNFDIPITSYMGVLQHHEKYDGTGYPQGKRGQKISLFGRIISIADVYDALTSDRPYRKALLPSDAIEYIMGGSGTIFDLKLVSLFVKKVAAYPIGTCVKLSNGLVGIVVENYEECCTRPKIKVLKDDGIDVEPYYINLKDDLNSLNVTIVDVVNI